GDLMKGLFESNIDYWAGTVSKLADSLGKYLVGAVEVASSALAILMGQIESLIDLMSRLFGIESKELLPEDIIKARKEQEAEQERKAAEKRQLTARRKLESGVSSYADSLIEDLKN